MEQDVDGSYKDVETGEGVVGFVSASATFLLAGGCWHRRLQLGVLLDVMIVVGGIEGGVVRVELETRMCCRASEEILGWLMKLWRASRIFIGESCLRQRSASTESRIPMQVASIVTNMALLIINDFVQLSKERTFISELSLEWRQHWW